MAETFNTALDPDLLLDAPVVNTTETASAIQNLGNTADALGEEQLGTATPVYDVDQVAQDISTGVDVKAAEEFITPEMMVEDRFLKLLDPDSAIMQRQKSLGNAEANALGLMSTAKGASIGQGRMQDTARAIAETDARTVSDFGKLQAQTEFGIEDTKASGIVSGALNQQEQSFQNMQSSFDKRMTGVDRVADAQMEAIRTTWEQDYTTAQTNFATQFEDMLSKRNISAAVAAQGRDLSVSLAEEYQLFIENTLSNPYVMEQDSAAIANVLDMGFRTWQGNNAYLLSTMGLEPSPYQQVIFDDMSWGTTTPAPAVIDKTPVPVTSVGSAIVSTDNGIPVGVPVA